MKAIIILTLAFVSGTLFLKAQEVQNRSLTPFQKMEISGTVNVYYTPSDSLILIVKAWTGEIDHVETRVENGTLLITNRGRFTAPVAVYLKSPPFKQLQAGGASAFRSTGEIKTDSVLISVFGSASVNTNIKALNIRSIQSGASLLTLSGRADRFSAELSGASSLKAYDLTSKTTDVFATGASSSRIYVTDKLKANAAGASSIKIKGDVTDINAEAGPAASITKIAENEKIKGEGNDSTVYNWRGRKIIIIGKGRDRDDWDSGMVKTSDYNPHHFKHWIGVTVGVNGFMAPGGGINLPAKSSYMELNYSKSFNFQINIIERQFNIIQDHFKIITGFGIDYHSYELKNKTSLSPDSSFTGGKTDSSGKFTYNKNRLRNTYIQVPLLLEFNTSNNPCKTFHLALGVIGEYLISSRTRQVLEEDNYQIVRTRKDNYNLSPFIAKAHVNIGYNGWTIFGEYNLTPLFQGGKGPELYPFTIGIRVIPFG